MHTFTIVVNKRTDTGDYTFTVTGEAVTAWIDDPDFHDGLVREYLTISVEQPGTLEQVLKDRKLDAQKISSLKVSGTVNHQDLNFMGQSMPALTYLNLRDVRIDDENNENDDVIIGFANHAALTRVILPTQLRGIGDEAFFTTNLTGTLDIPEGVTFIGNRAFTNCPFKSKLNLPSTIKKIGGWAFAYTDLEGELLLPEGLETIGDRAFAEYNATGSLILPQTLRYIGESAFASSTFSGDLVLPQGITIEGNNVFEFCKFNHIEIPEGFKSLGIGYFKYVPLQGELILPGTLEEIKAECFRSTNISSVVLPENLKHIERSVFEGCSRLEGIITIPSGVEAIAANTFKDCGMLSGIVLHENVYFIGQNAFQNCYNLNSIVCNAETPPAVEDGAFDGVPKDNFSIEVPANAIAAYKQANGWKEFKRITAYSNFICRPSTACALNTMHEETLILNADGAWEVTHQPDWCKLSQTSGSGKTTIRMTFDALSQGAGNRKDSIVFSMTDQPYTTYCTLHQYDYEYGEDQLVTLQEHTQGNGVDIVFLGDGYDAESIANGDYLRFVQEEMDYFFGLPPYDRLRGYFNVYAGIALSQETGINTANTYRNTRFGTIYVGSQLCGGSTPRLMPDDERIFPYLTQSLTDTPFTDENLRQTLVILVPNTSEYNGVTYLYEDNRAIAICPRSEQAYPNDTRGVIQREAGGFGFGKLANEAITKNQYAPIQVVQTIQTAQERGWYKNISTNGKMAEVPWSDFIFDNRYSNYVDIFEDGFDYTRNIYRSESNSCLSTGIPYYNAISRLAITQRVKEYAGEPFDLEEFYTNDTSTWGTVSTRSNGGEVSSSSSSRSNGPVIVKGKYIPNKPIFKNK
ncbi:leucine-rich repeat protein [uncultured Bacteroides sp.]|uniref:leucine-rich repeat protein n=1 Tax=uncultured Bacteroides sp. TaxID=162156 RepID=UPI00260974FD|nr:leucine-rich repeat protein [uncultured Bacteroides sp.]